MGAFHNTSLFTWKIHRIVARFDDGVEKLPLWTMTLGRASPEALIVSRAIVGVVVKSIKLHFAK